MSTTPYPYQLEGVKAIEEFGGRALLADEMGLGKSYQALLYFKNNPGLRPAIVVCPASLKWNWEREAKVHIGIRATILESRKARLGSLLLSSKLIIINYDILKDWVKVLRKLDPGLIVLDECHYLQNQGAKWTKATRLLCKGVPCVLALSGTPLTNRPAELFPTLSILLPRKFRSFYRFAYRYCKPERKPWGMEFKGAKNLDKLHRVLRKRVMIRRLKADVLQDLPTKRRIIVPLEIDNRKEYESASRDFLSWLVKNVPKGKVRAAIRAAALTRVGYLKRLAAVGKLKAVKDWVDNFFAETEEKLVLFAVHRKVLYPLEDYYGKRCVVVDGDVTGRDRQKAFDRFNHSERRQLFLGQLKAAGTGWSCTSSSNVAFCEFGWTPGSHTQAEDRCHGLKRGQDGVPLTAFYLIAKGTIEEDICEILQKKQHTLNATLDGEAAYDELSLFDQLIGKLRKAK